MHKKSAHPARKSSPGERKDVLFRVTEEVSLMEFLIAQLPSKSRDNIKSLLRNKQVWVGDQIVSQFNHQLLPGQMVRISGSRSRAEKKFAEFTIVFEDDSLIVIDKSAGLLSIATGSDNTHNAFRMLSDYVKTQDPKNKIFIVHRLDRETSGLMVYAKNEEVKKLLQENWNTEETQKCYVALVEGQLEKQEGTIVSYLFEDKVFRVHSSQNPNKGLKAITNYRVLESNANFSLLQVELKTGRKNQIRVHLQEIGHSIVGDKKYGAVSSPIRRLGLHAQQLRFVHPVSGEKLHFETKVPSVFHSLLKRKYK
ncbi:RluA family pseudouridine synthase [Maribellus sp. YY47]|uniref:RluA family pseudouridine synthase n=1 Tax=Maribellus sp. YY47 TaxID=2929486 RepID=UPI00200149BD|nr:RluA family pseudouridine synthase [Maribellus sp. YY47]MCK3686023.1 RluA family pseudouridine synthase [Maribellus sp. YY47]